MTRRILYIGIWILLLATIWYGTRDEAAYARGRLTAALSAALSFPGNLVHGIVFRATLVDALKELEIENMNLRAELLALEERAGKVAFGKDAYVRANVYSTYPLSNKHLITINAGSAEGLAPGLPVTVDTHLFLGNVVEVFARESIVRTLFDDEMRIAVKIGEEGAEALLVGGRTPTLTLIVKDARIALGERVYTATRELPFGITVGTVADIRKEAAEPFQEARIELPYDIQDLGEVFVRLP